jgi:hypothetical protein
MVVVMGDVFCFGVNVGQASSIHHLISQAQQDANTPD